MLLDTLQNRFMVTGELVCQTALRIGAGRSTEPIGTDLPVIKDGQGNPFIPGSSLKGILRSRVESFVRAISPSRKGACNPVGDKKDWCVEKVAEDTSDEQIYEDICLVCQAFGSPWFASKVQVRDASLVDPGLWFGQYQVRNGVAIDRDTLTVSGSKLYDYEVVPAQTSFRFHVVAENLTDAQIGMLLIGLRPFEQGEISLGGGRSRGLGVVVLSNPERRLFAVNGDIDRLFRFLDNDQADDVWQLLTDKAPYLGAFREQLISLATQGGEANA